MANNSKQKKAIAAVIIGACLTAVVFDGFSSFTSSEGGGESSPSASAHQLRRSLMLGAPPVLPEGELVLPEDLPIMKEQQPPLEDQQPSGSVVDMILQNQQDKGDESIESAGGIYSWAGNLRPLSRTPEPERETFVFWHIPKSGGSTAKALYRCLGKSIDTESHSESILRAKEMGRVQSGQVDIIFSSFPGFAVEHLFDNTHKGRMLAMFRNPVDRLISKFFYLQVATWEKTYRPQWKGMDILEWVQTQNFDNDHMVKKLAGKIQMDTATELDLLRAKRTIQQRFVIGLTHEMEESIHRFNTFIGIDEGERRSAGCMNQYFGDNNKKKINSNPHEKVEKTSEAYQLLAERNALDIQLYEYALELFEEQKNLIDSYKCSLAMMLSLNEISQAGRGLSDGW